MNSPREIQDDAHDDRLETPGGQVDLVDAALHAVARFPFTILACTVLGASAGLLMALSLPNQYTSMAQLLLRLGAREQLTPEAAIDSESKVASAGIQVVDQLLIWADPALTERVASAVGPARLLARYDPTQGDDESTSPATRRLHAFQAWILRCLHGPAPDLSGASTAALTRAAAMLFSQGVQLQPVPNSSTVGIGFTSHDPELARDVVKAYIEVIQQRHQEIFQTVPQLEFIGQKLEEAELEVTTATTALRDRQSADGVYDVAEMIALNSARLESLSNERESAEVRARTLKRQLALLSSEYSARQSELAAMGVPMLTSGESAEPAETVATASATLDPTRSFRFNLLQDELKQVLLQLKSLAAQYSADSPVIAEDLARLQSRRDSIELELEAMEAEQVKREMDRALAQQFVAPLRARDGREVEATDPILQELQVQRLTFQQEQLEIEEDMHGRATLVTLHQERHEQLLAMEPIHANLAKTLDAAHRTLSELADARARIETRTEIAHDERMRSLVVTQAATLPVVKDGPKRGKIVGGGLLGGTVFGAAIALLRQLLDRRLRYPKNVARALGIPVLGVVPEERRWRLDGKRISRPKTKSAS
jgi:uncharacterized protein involved in exopolysaccharide biosynthesis